MGFTQHFGEITPSRIIDAAHQQLAVWCQGKADSPQDFRRLLEDAGIYVDPATARSWFYGRTLPSAARIIEIVARGATDLPEALLGPARAAASTVKLERKLETAEQNARAAKLEIAQLRQALDRRNTRKRG